MAIFRVDTNIVWNGMVAYRERKINKAIERGCDLVCTVEGQLRVMTIPHAQIAERILHYSKRLYPDKYTGKVDARLAYFWWYPDGEQFVPKKLKPKQARLL